MVVGGYFQLRVHAYQVKNEAIQTPIFGRNDDGVNLLESQSHAIYSWPHRIIRCFLFTGDLPFSNIYLGITQYQTIMASYLPCLHALSKRNLFVCLQRLPFPINFLIFSFSSFLSFANFLNPIHPSLTRVTSSFDDSPRLFAMAEEVEGVLCTFKSCRLRFDSVSEMQHHKSNADKHSYCMKCDLDFQSQQTLHLHKIMSDRHFACPECCLELRSEAGLEVHMRNVSLHHSSKVYSIETRNCTNELSIFFRTTMKVVQSLAWDVVANTSPLLQSSNISKTRNALFLACQKSPSRAPTMTCTAQQAF